MISRYCRNLLAPWRRRHMCWCTTDGHSSGQLALARLANISYQHKALCSGTFRTPLLFPGLRRFVGLYLARRVRVAVQNYCMISCYNNQWRTRAETSAATGQMPSSSSAFSIIIYLHKDKILKKTCKTQRLPIKQH